jgi:hypothetical protein
MGLYRRLHLYPKQSTEHNSLSSINIPFNSLSIIDGDGDTTVGNIVVTVIDDAPDTSIPVNVIVYEDLYIPHQVRYIAIPLIPMPMQRLPILRSMVRSSQIIHR